MHFLTGVTALRSEVWKVEPKATKVLRLFGDFGLIANPAYHQKRQSIFIVFGLNSHILSRRVGIFEVL